METRSLLFNLTVVFSITIHDMYYVYTVRVCICNIILNKIDLKDWEVTSDVTRLQSYMLIMTIPYHTTSLATLYQFTWRWRLANFCCFETLL